MSEIPQPIYWLDVERKNIPEDELKAEFIEGEFDSFNKVVKGRRDFLKIMGLGLASMPLVSCMRIPVKKALPYLQKNDTVVPGVANWYATYHPVNGGAALLVKTREGRPVKIEGNTACPYSQGGLMPIHQASVLSLYDSHRFKNPQKKSQEVSWSSIDNEIVAALDRIQASGKKIALVTGTVSSPSFVAIISLLKKKYSNLVHIVYDAFSSSSVILANKDAFGLPVETSYSFDKAELIVSFGADFLGTMPHAQENTRQYSSRRDLKVENRMLKHIQIESLMSLSGANADLRIPLSDSKQGALILGILSQLQRQVGKQVLPAGISLPATDVQLSTKLAMDLLEKRGKSVVLSDSKDKSVQVMVNAINWLLDNYNNTLAVHGNPYFVGANDADFEELVQSMGRGEVGAVLFHETNPAYTYYDQSSFKKALENVELKVALSYAPDETTAVVDYVLPTNYYLESWGDHFRAPKTYYFTQPVIQPLFGSRMSLESLLALASEKADYYEFLKKFAQSNYLTGTSWEKALHDGLVEVNSPLASPVKLKSEAVSMAFGKLLQKGEGDFNFSLKLYQKIGLLDGREGNNPWLHELPDPITKATWDNYLLISPQAAKEYALESGSIVTVKATTRMMEVPVLVQPGTEVNTVGLAIGYGRTVAGKVGLGVGVNGHPFQAFRDGTIQNLETVEIKDTGKKRDLALTQTHHSMQGRSIIKETTLQEYLNDPHAGNKQHHSTLSMWSGHDQKGHQWAMMIDLTKCTGCSGCIISCNAENNIPVVGQQEVFLRREMHWLRLDRYYKGDEKNPEVVFMPVMCQHCDNAPCETVCPVLATVQSTDGLNQQVYNRCVGTRYCANNCPYKVRRFNWFDYPHDDKYQNMALNPDVVVRSRGVMEKCSLCVHRIQEGKLEAKKQGRGLQEDDIKTACQQSCPANAIMFGDLNDPNSSVAKFVKNPRNYKLLEELNVRPRVSYLTKVRNTERDA
ncbi:MAG: 4Fe-4S dicluster domain-containing protein [Bdellovibrio sp.]|nr:4Fe-4S dicluster domain-containing protein [Bdellovibrio sp.]